MPRNDFINVDGIINYDNIPSTSQVANISIKQYGAKGDGATDDYLAFSRFITSVGTNNAEIYLPSGIYIIGTNLTIPSNISLIFANGAILSPNTGIIITINGYIDSLLSQAFGGTGTVGGVFKNKEIFPQWFGAKGDGITDDTIAIQSAINILSNGGTILFPLGTYILSTKITINKPIIFLGSGKGSDISNTNGSGSGVTTFKWNGISGGTMMEVVSITTNNYLFGCQFKDFLMDGNNLAANGINGRSVGYCKFSSLEGRRVQNAFILIDQSNGVLSQFNEFEDIHFVYGTLSAVQNACGIILDGGTNGLTTQNHIISITGLTYNGDLVRILWSDNNVIEKMHCSVQSGGAGYALHFANQSTLGANNNLVKYLSGIVKAESQTFGNRILHMISEGAGVSIDTGGILHYEVEDYTDEDIFTTRKYLMSDELFIPIGSLQIIDGSAANGVAASQWACINMPASAYSRAGVNVPSKPDWANGTLTTLRIYFTTDTANSGSNFIVRTTVYHGAVGNNITTPQKDTTLTFTVQNSQYISQSADIPLTLGYARDDLIHIAIQRQNNDTTVGNIQILGLKLFYQSTGPNSSGSGTYSVSQPYKN